MAIINQWGYGPGENPSVDCYDWNADNTYKVPYYNVIHTAPIFMMTGTFNTETGAVDLTVARGPHGSFGYTMIFTWKFENGATVELGRYTGTSVHRFTNSVPIQGHTSVELYMTCNGCGYLGWGYGTQGLLISRGQIQLTQKPTLTFLSNADPYTDSDNVEHPTVSSNTDKILIAYTYSGSPATSIEVQLNGVTITSDKYNNIFEWNVVELIGLSSGTTYSIKIRLSNGGGNSDWLETYIRTKYDAPTLSIAHNHETNAGLEDLTMLWSSNVDAKRVEYSIDNGSWITVSDNLNTTSGSFTITQKNGSDLYEHTTYSIRVRILSTSDYDLLLSEVKSLSCTTDAKAALTDASQRNLNIGDSLRIIKTNESGNAVTIKLYITTSDALWKTASSSSNDHYISFTQAEWDSAYRNFLSPANPSISSTGHNRINFKIRVVTSGRSREYTQDYTGWLNLTGNMLTAHANIGGVKRAQVWCNPDGSGPRKAVAWISTGQGTWRRGI